MAFTLKKKLISIGAVAALVSTGVLATSCNMTTSRQQKDLKLSSKTFDSKDFKELKTILQNEFQKAIVGSLYVDYYKDNFSKKKADQSFSAVATAKTNEELKRALINEKGGIGNYASDIMWTMFYNTRWNQAIPKKYRILLNKISTMYNRTINIYPTKIYRTVKDGQKVVHIDFQTDLQTTMKRRYMRKFIELNVDIPVDEDKDGNAQYTFDRLKKLFKIDTTSIQSVVKTTKNSFQLNEILKSTLFNGKGLADKDSGIISDSKLVNGKTISLSSGIFPLDTKGTDIYQPKYTGKIDTIPKTFKYNFGYNAGANKETLISLGKDKKVSDLVTAIKDKLFTNSKQELIKKLFGANGEWGVKISAQTWAGNDASHYTISDWVENIGHRSNIFYYIYNKKSPTEYTWYKTITAMGGV